jgi:hypothetical protein
LQTISTTPASEEENRQLSSEPEPILSSDGEELSEEEAADIETEINFKTEVRTIEDIGVSCFVLTSFTYNTETKKNAKQTL